MLTTTNPTAQQSQRWIIQALSDLLTETDYDQITISSICRRSGLDRRTFYRNFTSKSDVLEQYIDQLTEEYLQMDALISHPDKYSSAKVFFIFWSRHVSLIRNLEKCGLRDFLYIRFEKFSREHFQPYMQRDLKDPVKDFLLSYRIGGFWHVMLTWAAREELLSPEEMASIMMQII